MRNINRAACRSDVSGVTDTTRPERMSRTRSSSGTSTAASSGAASNSSADPACSNAATTSSRLSARAKAARARRYAVPSPGGARSSVTTRASLLASCARCTGTAATASAPVTRSTASVRKWRRKARWPTVTASPGKVSASSASRRSASCTCPDAITACTSERATSWTVSPAVPSTTRSGARRSMSFTRRRAAPATTVRRPRGASSRRFPPARTRPSSRRPSHWPPR